MANLGTYRKRREALRQRYLEEGSVPALAANGAGTGGVDHLALISSDIERTIAFYTGILGMRLTKVVENRDDPTSTHIFLDMGGGNMMAFFDFPEHGDAPAKRGIGAMHHVALKATAAQYKAVIANLRAHDLPHSIHGDEDHGSVYFRDPDDILLEVRHATEGY